MSLLRPDSEGEVWIVIVLLSLVMGGAILLVVYEVTR